MKDTQITIECRRLQSIREPSRRIEEIQRRFGVLRRAPGGGDSDNAPARRVLQPIRMTIGPGRIIAFVGPSGSGKSSAIDEIQARVPAAKRMEQVSLARDRAVVEAVAPHARLEHALRLLGASGLSEVPLWLRGCHELSSGEQWRTQLARALGAHGCDANARPLLCDEFGSQLHRRLAKAVAYNLRKLVSRRQLCVIVAVNNEDILADLQPNTLVRLRGHTRHEMTEQVPKNRPISFHRRLYIERGTKSAYRWFADMHYRRTDELGFVDRVFVLRERSSDDLLGVVVYAHGPIELALRNDATEGRFRRRPDLLNKNVRMLRRLVMHPDVRGCGLGHMLVRKTLPLVGTPMVECLAAMGEVNPVFERAGMRRIGTCPIPARQNRVLESLRGMGVDPQDRDFCARVCRRPRLRAVVARYVEQWYQATSGAGATRTANLTPHDLARIFQGLVASQPVYYLWRNKAA